MSTNFKIKNPKADSVIGMYVDERHVLNARFGSKAVIHKRLLCPKTDDHI